MPLDLVVDDELVLYGTVGDDWWDDDYFTSRGVVEALSRLGRDQDVTVRLNSGGGYVYEGSAIFAALKAHRGTVTAFIDGVAASAASVVAMGADRIVMRTGAMMMVHDPAVFTIGNLADHEKSVEMLDRTAASMADIYAERTGRSVEEMRAEMAEETWMTAQQAVDLGYADEIDDGDVQEATAFDYRIYEHAPQPLVALAAAKGWKFKPGAKAAAQAAKGRKETNMTHQTKPAPTAGAKDGITADDVAKATASARDEGKKEGASAGAESARNAAVEIVALATAAGVPTMAGPLIKEGVDVEAAKKRIDGAKAIKDAVVLAQKSCPAIDTALADSYIAAGASIEHVRADLFEKIAAAQTPEIRNAHPGGDQHRSGTAVSATDIYAKRRKTRAGWAPGHLDS